jgi:maltose phosphorylase
MTVHESSLSPCIHSILACSIGNYDKAYEMYLRTSRLDLDDYNNDTCDGCHITSMAGTWMAVVQGFGGMRVRDNKVVLNPYIPEKWEKYSFRIGFRNSLLNVVVTQKGVEIMNESEVSVPIRIHDKEYTLDANATLAVER